MDVSRGTNPLSTINKRIFGLFILGVLFISCGISKPKHTIDDYVLVPNAKEIVGNKGLTAFVFENNKRILPFQQFLVNRFNLQTYNQREIPFVINEQRFTLYVYDADETIKYINTFYFILKEQIPDSSKMGNQSDFIVLSVINNRNEDCLKDGSLYQNMVIKYLKNVKEEYFRNDK